MGRILPEPLRAFDGLAGAVPAALARVDAAVARYREHRDRGRILPNSAEAVRLELTYHSNAIEGNTLSLRETQLVIEGHAPTSGKTMRELYEARNHDRALRLVERWAAERPGHGPVSENELLEVHRQVLADIDAGPAGRFRSERVLIKGTRCIPPGSQKFGALIPALLERTGEAGVHPALRAAEAHYNLAAVHPFADGNGRTARLMMNYLFLKAGYPLVIVEVDRRADYLAALAEANEGRVEPFALLMLQSVERSVARVLGEA